MKIKIQEINLRWSSWTSWNDLDIDYRGKESNRIIPREPGVYRVKDHCKIIYIGKSKNLDRRVRMGLVKGTCEHCNRTKIISRGKQNLLVQWATTNRISAVEEDLLIKHHYRKKQFPEYNQQG